MKKIMLLLSIAAVGLFMSTELGYLPLHDSAADRFHGKSRQHRRSQGHRQCTFPDACSYCQKQSPRSLQDSEPCLTVQ